jgi:uncharacterized membrane protein YdjX (TVP38/TMEM64 family)
MMVRVIFSGLAVIALLVLASYLLGDLIDRHWMDAYVRDQGLTGGLLFVLAGGLLASIGMSRQVIAFLGGYGYGFFQGVLLSLLAVFAGCMLTFYVSRRLLRSFLLQHYSVRISRVEGFIHESTFVMALLIRLLPLGSNWMTNIAAGASGVHSAPFFLGSLLGYVPQMLVFSLVGSGTQVDQFWQVAVAMALLVMAAALGFHLYRRYRHGGIPDGGVGCQPGVNDTPAAS